MEKEIPAMCQRATCKTCGKATYRGCGMHVEQVLAGVPKAQRCDCAATGGGSARAGMLSRLFGTGKTLRGAAPGGVDGASGRS
jgi:hypothetical protein